MSWQSPVALTELRLAHPEVLGLLLLLPPLVAWTLARRQGTARFSSVRLLVPLPVGAARWGPVLLACLRGLTLALLVLALARPQTSHAQVRTRAEGIAIQLVIDTSYSMKARDYDLGSEAVSRLEAVKHAVRLFVRGDGGGLTGRPSDRIGLITFARDPDVVCPLTLDHAALLEALEEITLSPPVGTNIGDGLAWALDRLRQDPTRQRVVILLSDGSHNVQDGLHPREAARLAADLGIRVYTIGAVGSPGLSGLVRAGLAAGSAGGDTVDEPMLEQVARLTGGRYFRATDTDGLLRVYGEIDQLEKTAVERSVQLRYRDWFPAVLVLALLLLLLEQGLAATRLLRVP